MLGLFAGSLSKKDEFEPGKKSTGKRIKSIQFFCTGVNLLDFSKSKINTKSLDHYARYNQNLWTISECKVFAEW